MKITNEKVEQKGIENYAVFLLKEELAESTRNIYLREAKRFIKYVEKRKISKEITIEYKNRLADKGYAAATQNLHLAAVNHYLKFSGHAACTLKMNRIQGRKSLDDIITIGEYKKMLCYAKESGRDKYYVILKTLASTGIRVSELTYFTVEALKKSSILVTNKQKTREICVPDSLKEELNLYCEQNGIKKGAVFGGNTKKPISRIAVYKMLVHIADMAGIAKEKAHPHSFRHLFAITYMERYSNLFELADLLGHSSLETTRIYTRSTVKEKGQRISKLGL